MPEEPKNRVRTILLNIRESAVELQDSAGEMEGLLSIFLEGMASRIINLIDIALKEL
ncbi:unnamed protein product [marine sediment metagenome]|uniref:Uncharacterized protein n=1 Tax=marine sediment metagenome TaxID=412755 RepID=X1HTQ6_9ZZZZ